MIVLEFGSTGAEEMSVFHRLPLENGTNPPRLAVWPTVITLQARLPPPVPPAPPFPPEPPPVLPVVCDTPEQAIIERANTQRAGRKRKSFQAEQGQRVIQLLSVPGYIRGRGPWDMSGFQGTIIGLTSLARQSWLLPSCRICRRS